MYSFRIKEYLKNANIQAITSALYEAKVVKFLENKGYIVHRLDYGNYMPDYMVVGCTGIVTYLELKNYRSCKNRVRAIKEATISEDVKEVNDKAREIRKKMKRTTQWLLCVAYNGKETTVMREE